MLYTEDYCRNLLAALDQGFCTIEVLFGEGGTAADFRFLEVNAAFEQQTGLRDAVGRSMRELAPHREEHWFRIFGEVARTGQPVRFEQEAAALDRWHEVYAFRVGDPARHHVAILFSDITLKRRAQVAARQDEALLRRMMNVEGVGVLLFREDGTLLDANDEFLRMFGYRRDDVASHTLTWWTMTPAEYAEDSEQQLRHFARTGRLGPYEKEYLRKDGSRTWMVLAGASLGDGTLLEYCIDINDRKRAEAALRESEERLRLVVESANEYAIFTIDPDGRIQSWNIGAERIFGWTEEEAIGRHTRMIFTPEDQARGAAEEEIRTAREEGRAADERWHLTKDGRRFYASGVLTALKVDGTLTGFAKIARDLTERKQMEDAQRRAQDELERRVRERTSALAEANATLAAEVAERRVAEGQVKALFQRVVAVQESERRRIARDIHDQLGQPMTALRMSLEVARRSSDAPALHELIARSEQLAEEVDRSIDFLTWDLRPAALDHVGLSAALANLVKGWSERFGISGEFDTIWSNGRRLAPDVEANLYRLTQEALHNILKHAGAAHASVFLEARDQDVVLTIEDDGRGFDVGPRLNHADGGLGLVTMRERASLMGGELTIESTPGQGTTISVRVPITHVAETTSAD